ncbi:MAG: glycosyltransferase family 39 protein [Candidatus Omnitrophica bacterium]|nr:glycosyltransferase family 39 protein [Candidatus Omnitrophota bacterium]
MGFLRNKNFISLFRGRENLLLVLSLLFISLCLCWPLFRNEFPSTHDYVNSLMRHLAMRDFFGRGQFLPVWVPDYYYGYGGAVFNFYPPLFFVLSASMGALGVSSALAINLASFLVVFFSGWAMFVFLKELTGRSGAFLGATAYMMAPYHVINLYLRGALAELTAFIFLPLIFWGIYRVMKEPSLVNSLAIAFSVMGLLLSHTITAMFFLPMAVSYLVYVGLQQKHDKTRKFYFAGFGMLAGFALAAFSILPAVIERKYLDLASLLGGQFDYHTQFVHPIQFILSPQAYGIWKAKILTEAIPFQFSWVYLFSFCMGTMMIMLFASREVRKIFLFFLFLFFITGWMMTSYSGVIWEWFPILRTMQFPWRLLAPASFLMCACIAGFGVIPSTFYRRGLCVLGVIMIMVVRMPVSHPSDYRTIARSDSSQTLRTMEPVIRDFQPVSAKHALSVMPERLMDFPNGSGEIISHQQRSPVAHTFQIVNRTPSLVCFYNYYFPGWEVYIDGQRSNFLDNEYGLMLFAVGAGRHGIDIHFSPTPVRILGGWISFLCFIGIIFVLTLQKFFPDYLRFNKSRI